MTAIMIYIYDEIEKFNEEDICNASSIMPPPRKKAMERYRFFKDKRLCCIAYFIFLYALDAEKKCSIRDILNEPFLTENYGKPILNSHPDINFNLSHCDKAVSCGISPFEIGVDIQDFEQNTDASVMKLVFSPEEIADVNIDPFPQKRFFRYWTIKESYYKCIGTGLIDNMNKMNFVSEENEFFCKGNYFFRTKMFDDYQLSVCEKNGREASENIIFISHTQLNDLLKSLLN